MQTPFPMNNAFPIVDRSFVNVDNSHTTGIPFTDVSVSKGPHLAGGSRKRVRKSRSRRVRRIRSKTRRIRRIRSRRVRRTSHKRKRVQRAGYAQMNLNRPMSHTFGLGGVLPPSQSSLANPPPILKGVQEEVDNLNHAVPNAYGNEGSGSGFPSKGWF